MSDTTLFHTFFDYLPGMAFQLQMGDADEFYFNYVSPGSLAVLDISRQELEQNPHLLLTRIYADDQAAFLESLRLSILNTADWNWEGRILVSTKADIKWVNLRATCRKDPNDNLLLEGFIVNISQNKQNEIELKQAHQQLRELSTYIENFKEQERSYIARKIHDDIGVLLTALRMDLAWLTQRLPKKDEVLQEKSRAMASLLDSASNTVISLIHSLRPGYLDCFGIVASIEIEAKEFSRRTGILNRVIKGEEIWDLSEERSTTLFRAFQDILNHLEEFGDAQHLGIRIKRNDDCVSLTVSSDASLHPSTAFDQQHLLTLRIIQQRLHHLNGSVNSQINDEQETEVTVCLPLLEHIICSHSTKHQRALF